MFDQAVQHIYVGNGHAPIELGHATFVFLFIRYFLRPGFGSCHCLELSVKSKEAAEEGEELMVKMLEHLQVEFKWDKNSEDFRVRSGHCRN